MLVNSMANPLPCYIEIYFARDHIFDLLLPVQYRAPTWLSAGSDRHVTHCAHMMSVCISAMIGADIAKELVPVSEANIHDKM